MAELRRLSMPAGEARRLAIAAERAGARDVDWCIGQLDEREEVIWGHFIPRLRLAHAAHPELLDRLRALAAPRLFGMGGGGLLRLRANLALLWLDVDAGLAPVVEAIEGRDANLRAAALEGVSVYREDLRWPDRYYEALFACCRRAAGKVDGVERARLVGRLFDWPVPALVPAMRAFLGTARGSERQRASLWLLGQDCESDARPYIGELLAAPFPQDAQERARWYEDVKTLMRALTDYYVRACSPETRAWAAATVLILVDRLVGAAQVEGEPNIDQRWYSVSGALSAIKADIPPSAHPLIARWIAAHAAGTSYRAQAFAYYAPLAGAAAVDMLVQELMRTGIDRQGAMVRQLRARAPAARYPELVPVLRALFDAVPPQETDSFGYSYAQDTLAALAAALAQFDPDAAVYVEPRLAELGPAQQREAGWALAGLTPERIAALLAEGGAIVPLAPGESLSFRGEGSMVRDMLMRQDRLALFNSRDDDIDSTAVRVVKKLARMCMPPVALDAVTEQPNGGVRFVHADGVFEITEAWDEEYGEAAVAFDLFLAEIGHPQRVFAIGDDGAALDNDAGVFFCADPVRMPGVAAQLGYPITPVREA